MNWKNLIEALSCSHNTKSRRAVYSGGAFSVQEFDCIRCKFNYDSTDEGDISAEAKWANHLAYQWLFSALGAFKATP